VLLDDALEIEGRGPLAAIVSVEVRIIAACDPVLAQGARVEQHVPSAMCS